VSNCAKRLEIFTPEVMAEKLQQVYENSGF